MGVANCNESGARERIFAGHEKRAGFSKTRTSNVLESGLQPQPVNFPRLVSHSTQSPKHVVEPLPRCLTPESVLAPPPAEELKIISAVRTMKDLRQQNMHAEADEFADAISISLFSRRVPLILEEVEAVWHGFPAMSTAVSRLIVNLSWSLVRGELFDFKRIQEFAQRNPVLQLDLSLCCEQLAKLGGSLAEISKEFWRTMENEPLPRRKHRGRKESRILRSINGHPEAREPSRRREKHGSSGLTGRGRKRTGERNSTRLLDLEIERLQREIDESLSDEENVIRRRTRPNAEDDDDAKTVTGL